MKTDPSALWYWKLGNEEEPAKGGMGSSEVEGHSGGHAYPGSHVMKIFQGEGLDNLIKSCLNFSNGGWGGGQLMTLTKQTGVDGKPEGLELQVASVDSSLEGKTS